MSCLGVHFAIEAGQAERLTLAANDSEILSSVQEEIEARWDEEWLYQTDKAWDAIHRCLTDGFLTPGNGDYPLSFCILGGRTLYLGSDYIVRLVDPDQAGEVGRALANVKIEDLAEKYWKINPHDYGVELSEEDFTYTWDYFSGLPDFFARAAAFKRFVVFTADQ